MSTIAIPAVARTHVDDTAVGTATAALLVVLLAEDGGFFSTAWGWTALVLLWAAALGLLVTDTIPARAALLMTASFAGLAAWTAASTAWSTSATRSLLETQRVLVYPAGLAALFVLARRRQRAVLAGAAVAVVIICVYALTTRLFPERLGVYDPVATYRLSEPVGYWNALGLVAAIGLLLTVGYATTARPLSARAAAGAALPALGCTIFFTFSRGAWAALAVGLVVAVALERRRLRLVIMLLALAPWTVVAVVLSSRSHALTTQGTRLADATHDGHRLALALLVLSACSAAAAGAVAGAAELARAGRRMRVALAVAVISVGLTAAAVATAYYGRPDRIVSHAYTQFTAPPPPPRVDLNRRLFTVSSGYRNLQWHVAWDEFVDHPALGSGAGTYEQFWLRHRTIYKNVEDAHNLYVETLAELGLVGLALLGLGLAVPVWAAVRRRAVAFVPAAAAAYAAYLFHAAIDWDWELTGVTLLALAVAGVLVLEAGGPSQPLRGGARLTSVAAAFLLGLLALGGALAQAALADSRAAVQAGHAGQAARDARTAHRWAPWSSEPWEALGNAQENAGLRAAARRSYSRAAADDPHEWQLWLDVARVSDGRGRSEALARARALNPLSLEVAQLSGGAR